MDKATQDTITRINWRYGRGEYIGFDYDASGALWALFAKQWGIDRCRVTFPKPGFVRVRGVTRKIKGA